MTEFAAPRWLRSPHIQTLGAAFPLFAPPRSHAPKRAEDLRIPLLRGAPVGAPRCAAESIDAHHRLHARAWWADGDGPRAAVVVVHGIGGSSESRYVVRTAVALHRAGHHAVRLDLRGAGTSVASAPSLYHAGLSGDLALVAEHLAQDPRVSSVVFLGFSGGGTLALKLAGEWADAPPSHVRAIVSVSAPLDYTRVGPWMDSLARLPYRFHVLRGLTDGAKAFARLHPERAHYRPSEVRRMSSFRHYDSSVIVPMHGFSDVDAYYEAASAGRLLAKIAIPTLLVHAEDDPMVPSSTVRPWLANASRAVEVALSPQGGHLGWVSGFDEASWITGWSTRRALDFLATTLGR